MCACCFTRRLRGVRPLGQCRSGRFVRAGPGSPSVLPGTQQAGPAGLKTELGHRPATWTLHWPKHQVPAVCCSLVMKRGRTMWLNSEPVNTTSIIRLLLFLRLQLNLQNCTTKIISDVCVNVCFVCFVRLIYVYLWKSCVCLHVIWYVKKKQLKSLIVLLSFSWPFFISEDFLPGLHKSRTTKLFTHLFDNEQILHETCCTCVHNVTKVWDKVTFWL